MLFFLEGFVVVWLQVGFPPLQQYLIIFRRESTKKRFLTTKTKSVQDDI